MLRGEGSSAADLYEFASRGPWRLALGIPELLPQLYVFESTGTDGNALHFRQAARGESTSATHFLPYGRERIYLPVEIIEQLHPQVRRKLGADRQLF
jgi:hypothetical protein